MFNKLILIAILVLSFFCVSNSAIIEINSDQPVQWFDFVPDSGYCDPDVIIGMEIWIQIDPDSGFGYDGILEDSISSDSFGYMRPDTDTLDNYIPGHYQGEYWLYSVTIYNTNIRVLSSDTLHVTVDYYRLGGCLPVYREP